MTDTKNWLHLVFPAEIGATSNFWTKGISYSEIFIYADFWETEQLSNIGRLIVSKAFVDKILNF